MSQGIFTLAEDEVFVVGIEYTYEFALTVWGWIHIVLVVLMAAVGGGVLTAAAWARVFAVIVAAVSIMGDFLWQRIRFSDHRVGARTPAEPLTRGWWVSARGAAGRRGPGHHRCTW